MSRETFILFFFLEASLEEFLEEVSRKYMEAYTGIHFWQLHIYRVSSNSFHKISTNLPNLLRRNSLSFIVYLAIGDMDERYNPYL